MYQKFASASEADAAAHVELAGLAEQERQVGAAASDLASDRGVEAGIRERYGVARPGEGQIDIVRREASSTPSAAEKPNVFVRMFRALFVW
jgi:hypothetical protein